MEIAFREPIDKAPDVYMQRAGPDAVGIDAMQAPRRFFLNLIGGKAKVDFPTPIDSFRGRNDTFQLPRRFRCSL